MRTGIALVLALLLLAGLLAWLFSGGGVPLAEEPQEHFESVTPALGAAQPDSDPGTFGPGAFEASRRQVADRRLSPGLSGRLLRDGRALAGVELRAVVDDQEGQEAERCTTGAEGLFFLALPAGRYSLEARGADVPRSFAIRQVGLVEGQHRNLGDLIVPAGAAVAGRVIDPQGTPLSGVRVYARTAQGPRDTPAYGWGFRFDVLDPQAAEADANVLTGADGRFAIGGLLPGNVLVLAEHPERRSQIASLEVESGSSGDIGDLLLQPATALQGFVFDRQGAPIADARVTPGGGRAGPLSLRHAVRTGRAGSFMLRGSLRGSALTVEKDGFEPLLLEAPGSQPQPLRITLHPALILEGVVIGNQGRVGVLELVPDRDKPGLGHPWLRKHRAGPHPVAADGRFRVAGLPEGRWWVGASVPGVGSALPQPCTVPLEAPLELTLVPDRMLTVTVVDDLGSPLPKATVARVPDRSYLLRLLGGLPPRTRTISTREPDARETAEWLRRSNRIEQQADSDGKAAVRIPAQEALQLAATAPGHLSAAIAMEHAAMPETVTIVLARGGVLHGTVADAGLSTHLSIFVTCALQENGCELAISVPVTAAGRFRSQPLAPGGYLVRTILDDPIRGLAEFEDELTPPAPLPLLTGRSDTTRVEGDPVLVEIAPGRETLIELPALPLGELRGRVLAGGLPVAGALVYGKATYKDEPQEQSPFGPEGQRRDQDRLDAYKSHPYMHTDAEGRFRFLVGGQGAFSFHARHPLALTWSKPIHLHLDRESRAEQDIALQTGAIRGSFALAQIEPSERQFLRAQLCLLQDASFEPDLDRLSMIDVAYDLSAPLGPTGAFAFECLAPGSYVLHLGRPGDSFFFIITGIPAEPRGFLLTRVLDLTEGQSIDLGLLEPDIRVRPALHSGLQPGLSVEVRLPVEGSEGVWVRSAYRDRDGEMKWGTLAPGRYLLYAFRTGGHRGAAVGIVGDPVAVEVFPDGSCTPEVVWPDGIRE